MNTVVPANEAYHTFLDYPPNLQALIPGIIVPQHVYNPAHGFPPREHMRFLCNGKLGIRLADAVNGRHSGLQNAAQTMRLMQDGATAFTFAIHWPGYAIWQQTGGLQQPPHGLTLAQLSSMIARLVVMFIRKTAESGAKSNEPKADWEITNVALESLFLLELRHLGGGAWQPVLCREMT